MAKSGVQTSGRSGVAAHGRSRTRHGVCGLYHGEGRCPADPTYQASRANQFAEIKANGGAFKGVVREDGAWHRRPGRVLVKVARPANECIRVGMLGWLLRTPLRNSKL